MTNDKAIQVQDLHKKFDQVHAVRGVSFEAQAGEMTNWSRSWVSWTASTWSSTPRRSGWRRIGALSRTEDQVITLSLIAMFLFAALGGAWFPLEITGEAFATVGHVMPTAWAMDRFQNIVVRGQGLGSVLLPAGLLLVYAAVFFGLAVWRFSFE